MKFFKKFLYVMGAAVIILILSNIIYCNRALEITNYKLSSDKLKTNFRIALFSDQHNKQFGKNDRKLVQKISEQKPDIIAVDGDMVTDNFANDEVMKNLLVQLAQIAPTYYCLGNHERNLASQIDFKTDIENCGAVLLDNESIEIKKNGESVLLGGLSDYPFYDFNEGNDDVPEKIFWYDFCGKVKNQYSILLHHQPEYIYDMISSSPVDLVLCGHTHGGLIRIPFIGGLFAPNQGFFPKYDKGEFDINNTKMIITSGLGNSNFLPRINNCPEICIIDIN